MFTKCHNQVSINKENENRILEQSKVIFEYDDLDSVQVATLVTSLLYNNKIIEPDDEKGFVFLLPFSIEMRGFESWMGLVYPDFVIKYDVGSEFALFKDMQKFKEMVRDYR